VRGEIVGGRVGDRLCDVPSEKRRRKLMCAKKVGIPGGKKSP